MTQLRPGFYPEGHYPLRWRPEDVSASAWLDANQTQRAKLFVGSLPGREDLTEQGIGQFVREAGWDPAYRTEVMDEVARDRARRGLYDLWSTDQTQYAATYDTLHGADRAAYDAWEAGWHGIMQDNQTAEDAPRRVKPTWEELFAMGLDDHDEYEEHLATLPPNEQRRYHEWEMDNTVRLSELSEELFGLFATTDEGGNLTASNLLARQEHWQRYDKLDAIEATFYERWMAGALSQATKFTRRGLSVPLDLLYDAWINTGENESPVWGRYGYDLANLISYGPTTDKSPIKPDYLPGVNPDATMAVVRLKHRLEQRKMADLNALGITSLELTKRPLFSITNEFAKIHQLREVDRAEHDRYYAALPAEMQHAYLSWERREDTLADTRRMLAALAAQKARQSE